MKTKKIIITLLAAALVFSMLLSACGKDDAKNTPIPSDTPGSSTEEPSSAPNQGITVNDIEFEVIDIAVLDDAMKALVPDLALAGGFYYWVDSEGVYTVFIGLGERSTAGYGIKVISVEDNEGITNILVEETKPGDGEIVAQVLTYPYTLIQMDGITDNFNIVGKDNAKFEYIEVSELGKHMVVCIYEGLIDNTSIETTLDGAPAVFRNDEMASKVDGLDEGTMVRIIYSANDEGQMTLESISPVDEGSGIIIADGIYQGLIDGNSLEVLVDGVYMALRNPDVENMAEGLEKDDEVEIAYSISDEGQFLLESIEPSE